MKATAFRSEGGGFFQNHEEKWGVLQGGFSVIHFFGHALAAQKMYIYSFCFRKPLLFSGGRQAFFHEKSPDFSQNRFCQNLL
ncbi:MAG TPA: hypothetical protein PKI76_06275 [Oscillospiraceae bacterium]|nr:hypothetical protein [Oscillospiraceae bacterium]HNW04972.1 hypothetical protein [Oscillospiraceae bacterium]